MKYCKITFRIIFPLSFSNLFLKCTSQLNEEITRIKFHNSSNIYVEILYFLKKLHYFYMKLVSEKKDLFSCKRDFLSEQWDISDQCGGKVREMIGLRGKGGFNGKGTDPRWSQTLQSGLQGGMRWWYFLNPGWIMEAKENPSGRPWPLPFFLLNFLSVKRGRGEPPNSLDFPF